MKHKVNGKFIIFIIIFGVIACAIYVGRHTFFVSTKKDLIDPVTIMERSPFVTTPQPTSGRFQYNSYIPESFDIFFDKIYADYREHEKRGPGADIYNIKRKLHLTFPYYPTPLADSDKTKLHNVINISGIPKNAEAIFTHKIEIIKNDVINVFYIQGPLVPYMQKEEIKGKEVDLYVIFVEHNQVTKQASYLVNEFERVN